jgi:hypothetical protein
MSESGLHGHPDDAMVDLLVKQITDGLLSPAELRELAAMDPGVARAELQKFERAAAALTLVGTTLEEPPAALRAALERQGLELIAAGNVLEFKAPPAAPPAVPPAAVSAAAAAPPLRPTAPSRTSSLGWLAAAACLLLAIFGWLRSPPTAAPPASTAQVEPPAVAPPSEPPQPPSPPTPAEERAAMLAQAGAVKVTLGATKDPAAAGVTGDAVWDPVSQKGFLHFVGLGSNDPRVRQYQIWVFDAKRDKRYPVDGGVFDVPAGASEVVIPIHASLPIGQAKAFAVTVEQPGGVVVSALGHVVALGAAG